MNVSGMSMLLIVTCKQRTTDEICHTEVRYECRGTVEDAWLETFSEQILCDKLALSGFQHPLKVVMSRTFAAYCHTMHHICFSDGYSSMGNTSGLMNMSHSPYQWPPYNSYTEYSTPLSVYKIGTR